jgi:prepilin-type N-terminal cleavage/methylation domain-containing protein
MDLRVLRSPARIVTPAPRQACRLAGRRGFTLVELMLSLALTTLIAGVIAGMLTTVCRGAADTQNTRTRDARRDVACQRIDGRIRACGRVLATGSGVLVLWTSDTDSNGKVNLSEILRLEYSAAGNSIIAYAAPAGVTPDTAYDLTADFAAVTAALRDTASFPGSNLVTGVSGWTVSCVTPLSGARMVWYQLALSDSAGSFTVRSAAALRATNPAGG